MMMKKIIIYFPEIILRHLRIWTLSELSFSRKAVFMFQVPIALFRYFILKKTHVNYFGNRFLFEHFVDPITLLTYPCEISEVFSQLKNGQDVKTVLDIGGNIGQFSITTANMTKVKQIDVLEPNPEIYSLLEQNTAYYPQIKLFNVGVGKKGSRTFYFKEQKSSTGSIVKSNANDDQSSLKKIKINLTDNLVGTTKRNKYDLIKIDVEGSEYEVIENLKGIKTRYLYMEISANREKSFLSSEIFAMIEKRMGKFDILWQEGIDNKAVCYNVLLSFLKV